MVQVLLIGAGGFLGRHVFDLLAGQPGMRVRTASRSAPASPRHGATGHVRLNLGVDGADRIGAVLAGLRPDVVINCSGATSGDTAGLAATNILGPAALVHAMLRYAPAARLVHLGSAAEYGATEPGIPITEATPPRPVADYGATKLAGTELVTLGRAAGLDALTLRVFNPVGPGAPADSLPGRLATSIARAWAEGDDVRLGPLDAVRDFVDARDVARAVCAAAMASTLDSPVLNVGGGRAVVVRDLVNTMVDIAEFPRLKAWWERVRARPAVEQGLAVGAELRTTQLSDRSKAAEEERRVLFGQR